MTEPRRNERGEVALVQSPAGLIGAALLLAIALIFIELSIRASSYWEGVCAIIALLYLLLALAATDGAFREPGTEGHRKRDRWPSRYM